MNENGGLSSNILILYGSDQGRCSAYMKSLFEAKDMLEIMQSDYEGLGADSRYAQRTIFK